MDRIMPFLVAYHCTIFIVNLLFLLCTLLLSLPRPTSAANPPAAAAAVDRRDRQTDGWTLNRFFDAYRILCGRRNKAVVHCRLRRRRPAPLNNNNNNIIRICIAL